MILNTILIHGRLSKLSLDPREATPQVRMERRLYVKSGSTSMILEMRLGLHSSYRHNHHHPPPHPYALP